MLKILDEVWASMPIEEGSTPTSFGSPKNYPKIRNVGGKWVGWGEEERSVSWARALDMLYNAITRMDTSASQETLTLHCFVPIFILNGLF
jgi:hypothetical protein